MKFLWGYIRRHKKLLTGALVLATINQGFSLLDPQIFRLIIDRYATRIHELSQGEFVNGVIILILAAMGVAFVSRVAKNFQDYFVSSMTQRVGAEMYSESVRHSFGLPYAVFEDQRSGELLQKLQKARTDSQAAITSGINLVFISAIGVVFVLIYAFIVHWGVGLAYVLMIPGLGIVTTVLSKRIKQMQKAIVTQTAELAGATTETLRNVELVKSLGLEAQEVWRLNHVNDQILALELKKIKTIRVLSFIQGTGVNLMRSALLFLMLFLVFSGGMTLGELFSLLFYSFFIFNPLYEFGTVTSQYQEAKASLEKLGEVLNIPQAQKPVHAKPLETLKSIEFQRVWFSYFSSVIANEVPLQQRDEVWRSHLGARNEIASRNARNDNSFLDSKENHNVAVQDVTIKIHGGETVAFVGPSGSGKSTLVKLSVGLYAPTQGKLFLNGIDSSDIDFTAFRSKVGLVAQETQLFAGTIRENLLFVNPNASDEECLEVMRQASITNILDSGGRGVLQYAPTQDGGRRRNGLDTKIGEGGIKISGGERQRLAIARALLRDPELIIFDEATSSLDSITEKAITQTIRDLERIRPNVITILVAHRLSTVMHAKKIYVLEKGRIIEQGNHEELLKLNGLYHALWREQAGGNM